MQDFISSEGLSILDTAVRNSLLVFILCFLSLLLFAVAHHRQRRRRLAEYMQEEFDQRLREQQLGESDDQEGPSTLALRLNRLRAALHALILAGLISLVFFLVFTFAPLPFIENFASESIWLKRPLRLTSLRFERFYEGFSLEAEVWNQTDEPIEGLQALVSVLDPNQELLDEVLTPVSPPSLKPGAAGSFQLRYTKNSPLIYGYQVRFQSRGGLPIPHTEGFDVR